MRYIRFQIFKVGKLFLYCDRQLGYPKEFNEANVALRTVVKEEATPKAIETLRWNKWTGY
jgi:hypothetical protein